MGRRPNQRIQLERVKRENLNLLYPAIHKEFTDLRMVPFRVATIYGSFSFLILGWTFANRVLLGISELCATLLMLTVIAGYCVQFLKNMEVHQQEVGDALNRMQLLLKAFDPGFYTPSFENRDGNTLFPLNWTLTGLPKETRDVRKRLFPKGTSGREIGFMYAQYFIFLMFTVTFLWVALLLAAIL